LVIVIAWTVPTFGLFISSLRDKDQLAVSGWWNALQTVTANARARTGVAADQVEADGLYVIQGSVFPEESNQTVDTFGGGFLPGTFTDYPAGSILELGNGQTFVMHGDGSYEWASPQPFDIERGAQWFYVARI